MLYSYKSKKPRVFRWIPCTTVVGSKTLTPAGDKLDVVLRTLYEDTSYDFENYRPVLVSDFNGNESDSSNRTDDFGVDSRSSGSDSDSDCEEEHTMDI